MLLLNGGLPGPGPIGGRGGLGGLGRCGGGTGGLDGAGGLGLNPELFINSLISNIFIKSCNP